MFWFNETLLQGRLANVVALPGWFYVNYGKIDEDFAWRVAIDLWMRGYPDGVISNLTTYGRYVEFAKWSVTTGVSPSDLNGAAAPLLSAALWAGGLFDVSNGSVRIEGFAPAATGLGWTLKVGLDAYDPRMLNTNLLQAAI